MGNMCSEYYTFLEVCGFQDRFQNISNLVDVAFLQMC